MFYCLGSLTLLIFIMAICSFAIFWSVKIINYRSQVAKEIDLSSSVVYDVTSDFSHGHLYSTQLCLNLTGSHSIGAHSANYYVDKVAYVSLASEDCDSVLISTKNETISQNSIVGSNYMFYWLNGSAVKFHVEMDIIDNSSVVTLLLLNDKAAFDLCLYDLTPDEHIVAIWTFNLNTSNCVIVAGKGWILCDFDYSVSVSEWYYVCINRTTRNINSFYYNLTLSSLIYDLSSSTAALQCTKSGECCLPFKDIFSEIYNPTCIYISTTPISPAFTGIRLTDISVYVDQRLTLFWYCIALLGPLLLILMLTLSFCRMTHRIKERDSCYTGRRCVLQCNLYSSKDNNYDRL